jgi:SAM-dependent methyltransferase
MAAKSRLRIIATLIVHALLRKTCLVKNQIGAQDPASIDPSRAASDLEHAVATFQGYFEYSGLVRDFLTGAQVLELGTGPNQAVALQFLAAGARRVFCVDKFVRQAFADYHSALYSALRQRLTDEARQRFDHAVDLSRRSFDTGRLVHYYGIEIGVVRSVVPDGSIDLIVSNAMIEEIYRIDDALGHMTQLLRPGGYMIHKIDFRDYGLFTDHGYSPFEFLTIREPIYWLMAEATGQPNRRLIGYYRQKMKALGYDARFCAQIGYEGDYRMLEQIRPRLRHPFRDMPAEDLLVAGAYLVAQKR